MSWAFAWESPEGDAEEIRDRRDAVRWTLRGVLLVMIAPLMWLLAYALGLFTTLGWAEGAETHDRFGVYREDRSRLGLGTMYLFAGETAWWAWDMRVEGHGGLRLRIFRTPLREGQHRFYDVRTSGTGRFAFVAPESGFYTFGLEHVPNPGRFGGQRAGRTVYDLSWGVD